MLKDNAALCWATDEQLALLEVDLRVHVRIIDTLWEPAVIRELYIYEELPSVAIVVECDNFKWKDGNLYDGRGGVITISPDGTEPLGNAIRRSLGRDDF